MAFNKFYLAVDKLELFILLHAEQSVQPAGRQCCVREAK
jgi:hypothetical protein